MSSSYSGAFLKDKNNELSAQECEQFLKDYNNFKKDSGFKIYNPKTNKQLTSKNRIEYIYLKCKEIISHSKSSSYSPASKSSSDKENRVVLDSYDKVKNIIELPINDIATIKKIISSLFSKPISLKDGLEKLNEYLNNTDRTQNIYVDAYYRYLEEINEIIYNIYYNNTLATAEALVILYNWGKDYKYNPLERYDYTSLDKSLIITTKEFKAMWKNIYDLNADVRIKEFMLVTYREYRKSIIYSENNKNRNEMMKNLDDNKYKYYAIRFILLQIRDTNAMYWHTHKNTNDTIILIDKLLSKNIFPNSNVSKSISDSISWSGTPRSSSSGHSHYQSKVNIEGYRKKKTELVEEIKSNNINDIDPYTLEEWDNMSLRKLKNVIPIQYTDEKNKTYSYAFYIRTLYQAWRKAVIDKKPFINPYTRKLFSEDDKNAILKYMMVLYPNITIPKVGIGRNDILYVKILSEPDIMSIFFRYIVKTSEGADLYVELIYMKIPLVYEIDIPPEYIPQILFENIDKLIANNKIFGKGFPLKIMDAFAESNNKHFLNFEYYRLFFDKIRDAL